jgi:O-antigen ligase
MPWLFASVMSATTVFRWRWRWLTVEMLLLVWAAVVLVFTYSRAGLLFFAVQMVMALLFHPRREGASGNRWRIYMKRVLLIGMIIVLLAVVAFIAGARNNYFARLWRYWFDDDSTGTYFQYIAFEQRFTYWGTAFQIFEDHPVMGIGLGNFTFYFQEQLSDRPLYPTPELLLKLVPEQGRNQVVVTKNLFARLLAESGLLGTATYVSFLAAILGCAAYLYLAPQREQRFWGQAGFLALIVFIGVSFSVDSFAIPNAWIVFGLVTASTQVYSRR